MEMRIEIKTFVVANVYPESRTHVQGTSAISYTNDQQHCQ